MIINKISLLGVGHGKKKLELIWGFFYDANFHDTGRCYVGCCGKRVINCLMHK